MHRWRMKQTLQSFLEYTSFQGSSKSGSEFRNYHAVALFCRFPPSASNVLSHCWYAVAQLLRCATENTHAAFTSSASQNGMGVPLFFITDGTQIAAVGLSGSGRNQLMCWNYMRLRHKINHEVTIFYLKHISISLDTLFFNLRTLWIWRSRVT